MLPLYEREPVGDQKTRSHGGQVQHPLGDHEPHGEEQVGGGQEGQREEGKAADQGCPVFPVREMGCLFVSQMKFTTFIRSGRSGAETRDRPPRRFKEESVCSS